MLGPSWALYENLASPQPPGQTHRRRQRSETLPSRASSTFSVLSTIGLSTEASQQTSEFNHQTESIPRSTRSFRFPWQHQPIKREPPIWSKLLELVEQSKPEARLRAAEWIHQGIPSELRSEYWASVTGAKKALEKNPGVFSVLLSKSSGDERYIEKDITRTMPYNDFFRDKGGSGQQSLFNVLKAYSILDWKLGYCQGMSFLAAMLLLYLDEETAFWAFCSVTKTYRLGGLYAEGLPLLRLSIYQLERLIALELPLLDSYLKKQRIPPLVFASEWFSTLYVYSFAQESVERLWDIFFIDGPHYLFKVALAILKLSQERVLSLDFEHGITLLKSVARELDIHEVIETAGYIDSFQDVTPTRLSIYEQEFFNPLQHPIAMRFHQNHAASSTERDRLRSLRPGERYELGTSPPEPRLILTETAKETETETENWPIPVEFFDELETEMEQALSDLETTPQQQNQSPKLSTCKVILSTSEIEAGDQEELEVEETGQRCVKQSDS